MTQGKAGVASDSLRGVRNHPDAPWIRRPIRASFCVTRWQRSVVEWGGYADVAAKTALGEGHDCSYSNDARR